MREGFLYLVAVMDWYSRRVLSWRLSNTMDSSFCVDALAEALRRFRCLDPRRNRAARQGNGQYGAPGCVQVLDFTVFDSNVVDLDGVDLDGA